MRFYVSFTLQDVSSTCWNISRKWYFQSFRTKYYSRV